MSDQSPASHPVTSGTRRLAAIMFTDMVGYTALVQEDEQMARTFRDRHRTVLQELVAEHEGSVLQYYGDGTLSTFSSAIQAVRASILIQRVLQGDPKIPLRIGLHVGDVIDEEGGVFGDGVNVAARIQSLGLPGAVLVSERIHDELRNQPTLPAVKLGRFELKNVREPVAVFALSAEGLRVPSAGDMSHLRTRPRRSVAVLPFVNMSRDPENEFFSDGISEEIINALTRVEGLQVTARTSSFAFKGKNSDIRAIGQELGVEALLEGSVRTAGDRVRVTAQLINTGDGFHAWSEVYDRKLEDIFKIQDEIAKAITDKLRLHFSTSMQSGEAPSSNLEAYQLYLKAIYHWNKFTPTDSRQALQLLQEATRLDPTFALAYAYQAFCYTFLGALGQMTPTKAFPLAKQTVGKAFALQGAITESYLAQALISLFHEWNWREAGASIRRALEISPGNASAHHINGLYLSTIGDTDRSVMELELAQKLDPMSFIVSYALAEAYYTARRFHDAIDQCRQTLLLDPTFRAARNLHAWVQIEIGETETAIRLLEETRKEIGDELKGWTQLGYAYAKVGRVSDAHEVLRKLALLEERERDAELSVDFAIVYEGLGNRDEVFRYLNRAIDRKSGGLVFIKTHPGWDGLRSDPRFRDLLRRIAFVGNE